MGKISLIHCPRGLKAGQAAGLLFLALCLPSSPGTAAETRPLEPARFPSLVSAVRIAPPLSFCGEAVPLEDQDVRERLEKELLLSLWDRPQVILWLKRSTRYLPMVEAMLKEQGMPEDLKYVAIAESALRAHAGSPKGAMGFWQFMPSTGRNYGLVVDQYTDQRRNLPASTRAAIAYFKDLRKDFGSWTLAAAAFNMGEHGLMAEILEQETRDFYRLYLPLETQRYVLRILAVKLILSDPEKYGFILLKEDGYPPLECEPATVKAPEDTPIALVARAAGTHFKMIKELNPEVRGYHLPKGDHRILVPKGAAADFERRFDLLRKEAAASREEQIYVVKEGDNLSAIAERFNVPLPAILIWNRRDPERPIHPGERLIIRSKQGGDPRGQ